MNLTQNSSTASQINRFDQITNPSARTLIFSKKFFAKALNLWRRAKLRKRTPATFWKKYSFNPYFYDLVKLKFTVNKYTDISRLQCTVKYKTRCIFIYRTIFTNFIWANQLISFSLSSEQIICCKLNTISFGLFSWRVLETNNCKNNSTVVTCGRYVRAMFVCSGWA